MSCLIGFIEKEHAELHAGRLGPNEAERNLKGKVNRNSAGRNKGLFSFSVPCKGIVFLFSRILPPTPGIVKYNAHAIWEKAINNCRDGSELNDNVLFHVLARPLRWLAVFSNTRLSCSVLWKFVLTRELIFSSLPRSRIGWLGLKG